MGMCPLRKMSNNEEDEYKNVVHKMRLLQQEIAIVMSRREEESKAYEHEVLAFTFKEAEWKRERKKLREELKRLQKKDNCKNRMLGNEDLDEGVDKASEKDGYGECCIEKMRQERARRDEAVEKWKMLYLAIKDELDDLIQRTTLQGGGIYWRAEEEDFMEEIHKEMNAKDETIDMLRAKVASLEEEEYKTKREVDILRQSLRIMCSKNKSATSIYAC